MRRTKRSDPFFMVIDVETHSGVGVKALNHEEAATRAKAKWLKGAKTLKVTLFAGKVNGELDFRPVFFNV